MYLSPKQIAEQINVSPITVRRWCISGELPSTKFGRSVRVKVKDFEKYCQENEL